MHDLSDKLTQVLRSGPKDPARDQRLFDLAANIREVGADPRSPSREILMRLGDRWSALLLNTLATGTYRHTDLHRVVNVLTRLAPDTTISQRMLTLRLRALERDGLVRRSIGEGNAPAVEYSLTSLGRGLVEHLQAVLQWTASHADAIRTAQQTFDAGPPDRTDIVRHRLR